MNLRPLLCKILADICQGENLFAASAVVDSVDVDPVARFLVARVPGQTTLTSIIINIMLPSATAANTQAHTQTHAHRHANTLTHTHTHSVGIDSVA